MCQSCPASASPIGWPFSTTFERMPDLRHARLVEAGQHVLDASRSAARSRAARRRRGAGRESAARRGGPSASRIVAKSASPSGSRQVDAPHGRAQDLAGRLDRRRHRGHYTAQPPHARQPQGGSARQDREGQPAGAERDAHAEQRGQRADLELAERRQADGDHPGAARPPAQVRGHAELQQALREQIGQRAGRVHDDEHEQHAREARPRAAPPRARSGWRRRCTSTPRKSAPPPSVEPRVDDDDEAEDAADRRARRSGRRAPRARLCSTSRARLGSSAWCAKPSISAPAVSIISASSVRSARTAARKSSMLCHSEVLARPPRRARAPAPRQQRGRGAGRGSRAATAK